MSELPDYNADGSANPNDAAYWRARAEAAERDALRKRIADLEARLDIDYPPHTVDPRVSELQARVDELEAAARWIPVSERLPEEETVVIVYDRHTDKVAEGYLSSEVGDWCENTWWLRRFHSVTHWMPKTLPAPPEESEGEG